MKAKEIATSRTELKILQVVLNNGIDSAIAKSTSQKIFNTSVRIDNTSRILHSMEDTNEQITLKIKELNLTRGDESNNESANALNSVPLDSTDSNFSIRQSDIDNNTTPSRAGSQMFDAPNQRKLSINFQRQLSRALDWEKEVVKNSNTIKEEEKEAAKIKSSCIVS